MMQFYPATIFHLSVRLLMLEVDSVALSRRFSKINPQMKGILFDAPPVIEGARRRIEAEGIADRCEVIAGDFFESVPSGGDAYILKWIIHDWGDERAIAILRNCHRVMTEYGKLLLVEAVVPRSSEPHFSKFIDLNMLVMTGGRELDRT